MNTSEHSLRPYPIKWTAEKVEFFWNWYSASPERQVDYFGEKLAEPIVALIRKVLPPSARVLDFGCGTGRLLLTLANAGYQVSGCDTSENSVVSSQSRLAAHPNFGDCRVLVQEQLPFPKGTFDIVVATETIEHLLPEWIEPMFRVWSDLLCHNGSLVLTTPNAENLDKGRICCPDCGCEFHRMQHIHSFSRESLERLAQEHGFETLAIITTSLKYVTAPKMLRMSRAIYKWYRAKRGTEIVEPNLVWIGRKLS